MHLLSCLRVNFRPIQRSHILSKPSQPPLKYLWRSFRRKPSSTDGGMKLAPQIISNSSHQDHVFPTLMKCFTFTVGFCGTVFVGASVWNYENIRNEFQDKVISPEWLKKHWNKMEGYNNKEGEFRKSLNKYWNQLPEGRKIFWAICAANVLVFVCWRSPALQSTMMKYFCSSPAGKLVCWPMFLSTFSHHAPLHLAMNMYVLHSFSGPVGDSLGKEQFLGFYLAGGVVSSFFSHFLKLMTGSIGPSLGASGAIMAMLGYFCTRYPDSQLGIIFLPQYPFSAQTALMGVMLLDISGLIFRWKLFDHAAHLGGAAFGLLYAVYGQSALWGNRSSVTKVWEDIRNKYVEKRDRPK